MECAEAVAEPTEAWWLRVLTHGSSRWNTPVCGDRHDAATWTFESRPRAVGAAREISAVLLSEWGMEHLSGDVSVVVSELVTNAVRHGGPLAWAGRSRSGIQLSLMRSGGEFICAVRDGGDHLPRRREARAGMEGGRGLALVSAFAREWGVIPTPPGGKFVWAQFV
ncbi:ATP-binding protein [Nocardiopsis sp. MG754419]|uniref:ATP-binding protein n=1 Tax=Nocardiopsis sp. MG754419 TaxID=2259865 RepID=UPI001BA4FF44|nr:ATP-binding protein [Nocardiopsis sp. MG754419]MBR8742199.1 ATP-binding protein [Nocardiopsis sp. MG754419]